jgi:hypothetical protein
MEGGTDTLTCTPSPRPFQQGKSKSTNAGQKADQKPTDANQKMKSPIDLGCEETVLAALAGVPTSWNFEPATCNFIRPSHFAS